jgi:hypothetical protein
MRTIDSDYPQKLDRQNALDGGWLVNDAFGEGLLLRPTLCENGSMTQNSLPQPHEQRRIEQLLVKLSKVKPISSKPAPIVQGVSATRGAACTAHSQVFFST